MSDQIRKDRFEVQDYEIAAWDDPDVVTEVEADDSPFEDVEATDADGNPIEIPE